MIKIKCFNELSTLELYSILELRMAVFVVEQNCSYLDLDGLDEISMHVWIESDRKILSYLRILPPGAIFNEASIGRIVTQASARKKGLGEELIRFSIHYIQEEYQEAIRINAQCYLEGYYSKFGFVRTSDDFMWEDAPHVEMFRKKYL